jgi:B9 domain-containing protein 1
MAASLDLASLTKSLKTAAAVERNENNAVGFLVSATGQVVGGELKGEDSLYVKYDVTYGGNWEVLQGCDKGISQIARRGNNGSGSSCGAAAGSVVWNFPVDVLFRSISPTGWPRIVVSVFGIDSLGRDIARGYGSMHIPTRPGTYRRTVRLFRPVCASYLHQFVAWLTGTQPEFFDSRFVSKGEGRDSTRVESVGCVTVQINVTTRGMLLQGYENGTKLPAAARAAAKAAEAANAPVTEESKNGKLPGSPKSPSAASAVSTFLSLARPRTPLATRPGTASSSFSFGAGSSSNNGGSAP